MFRPHSARAGSIAALALSFTAAAPLRAQVPISGDVSDSTSGPLLAGTVYHATGTLTVPVGQTLTVQPGAIVKFVNAATYWNVRGTIDCQGTPAAPVIFTDVRDDTAGGDTNGDGGASSPSPGHWHGTLFYGGSAGQFVHTEVRYAGWGGYGAIDLQGANVTLAISDSRIRDCASAGFDFDHFAPLASISNTAVERCGIAADNVLLTEVESFAGCTALSNAGDYVRVTSGSLAASATIGLANTFGNPLVCTSTCSVPAGSTLTLLGGVAIKMVNAGTYWHVDGVIDCKGTPGSPVVFTDFRDDTAGGDTNKDGGASAPSAGLWHGVLLYGGSTATLVGTEIRYAGWGAYGGIDLQGVDVTLSVSGSLVRDCAAAGFDFDGFAPVASVASSGVERCGIAADNVLWSEIPSFVDCTATENAGDYVRVTDGTLSADATVGPVHTFGNPVVSTATCSVPAGRTLTLLPGLVVKLVNAATYWHVEGALVAQGTAASPVIFTEFRDDTAGGDTNQDGGVSAPAPGLWHGILLYGGSSAALAHTDVRYAGWGGFGGIDLQGANVTLDLADSVVRDCAAAGVDFDNFQPAATVARCSIERCGIAVDRVLLSEVASLTDVTATGCAGNYVRTTNGTLPRDASIQAQNLVGGALVSTSTFWVPAGRRLTLGAGTVFKLVNAATYWSIDGALEVAGTPLAPVVLTEFRDDAWGGDTNGDGAASAPAPGFWHGLLLDSNADAMTIDGMLVRYAGWGGYPGVRVSAPLATVSNARAEHCADEGLQADQHNGVARGWIAYACGGVGIDVIGGAFDLDHGTAAKCASYGIRKASSWSGACTNSIAWSNTAGNFAGFSAGELRYSDGSPALAGIDGNIDLAPIFVAINAGDLHLKATSPCIDSGDPLAPPDLDGTRSDMGAYPFDQCAPVGYCTAKVNSLGCTPAIRFNGYASLTQPGPFEVLAFNVINNRTGIFFYGKMGRASAPWQGGTLCVNPPVRRTPLVDSGGNPPSGGDDCSGVLRFDFNEWMQAGSDPALVLGTIVDGQFWYRDPQSPSTTGLSSGIEFRVCP
jgi:hypothetical protein